MRFIGVSAMVLAVGLASCSADGSDAPSGPEPEIGPVEQVGLDPAEATTPFDAYYPTVEENHILDKAQTMLINDCLRDLGYSGPLLPAPENREPDPTTQFPSHVKTIGQARKHGYGYAHIIQENSGRDRAGSAGKLRKDLQFGEVSTFHGQKVPNEGCKGEAAKILTKGAPPPKSIETDAVVATTDSKHPSPLILTESHLDAFRVEFESKVDSHDRVKSVRDDWAACMASKGYGYATPSDAASDDFGGEEGGAPTQRETRTAVADMKCKKKVNYVGVMVAVQSAYEQQTIDQHPEKFEQIRNNLDTWLQNASRALSE